MESYQKSVEETNGMLETKLNDYETLVETMLQLDESRVGFVKTLLGKSVQYTEHVAKAYISRATSLSNIIECINGKSDIELFVSECENSPLNQLFIPIEYEQYEFK